LQASAARYIWLTDRDDSPWYPTLRLFRQPVPGAWEDVFEQMALALRQQRNLPDQGRELRIPVSPGELWDKITILELKSQRITDPEKLESVHSELHFLWEIAQQEIPAGAELKELVTELQTVNSQLWDIEEQLRLCEQEQRFDSEFIELARSVYRHNDHRSAVKCQINQILGASLQEVKSYPGFPSSHPQRRSKTP